MANPSVNQSFGDMSDAEKAALAVDPVSNLKIVASAQKAGVIWMQFEDGSEATRDTQGNVAAWPAEG